MVDLVEEDADLGAGGLARRPALLTALLAAVLVAALAATQVPWDWVPGGDLRPASASDLFTTSEIARAEEYSAARRWLSWSSYFLSLVVAVGLGLTSGGARIVRAVTRGASWFLAVPLAVLALLLIGRLLSLPFSVALHDLRVEYGLSNQAWAAWGVDQVKSLLVATVMTSLVAVLVVGVARVSPRYWFAIAGGLAAIGVYAGSFLYPLLVEPVFNDFESMEAGPFKSSVYTLAEKQGVRVDDVLVSDASRRTTTLNAYVSGLGSSRRVVVYDNLLEELTPEEARVVISHELAHAKHQDVLVGTTLGAAASVLGISLLALLLDTGAVRRRADIAGPGDVAVVPFLLAMFAAASFLVSPVESGISRAIEARADRDSITATGDAEVFVDMQSELARHSLSDPTPPRLSQFWFGSHPTVLERAGMPEAVAEEGR